MSWTVPPTHDDIRVTCDRRAAAVWGFEACAQGWTACDNDGLIARCAVRTAVVDVVK